MSEQGWPWLERPDDERREVRFKPAFHRCHPDPAKNYGVGSVTMLWFLVIGDAAVTWEVLTGLQMTAEDFRAANPECHLYHGEAPSLRWGPGHPQVGGPVGFHLPGPSWEGQEQRPCSIVPGGQCYSDVGYLLGDDLLGTFAKLGDEATWDRLRVLLLSQRGDVL